MAASSWIYLLVLIDLFVVLFASRSTPVIDTKSGPVRGKILRTVSKGSRYSAFKGIPYAKPPLGHLRFRPPVPVEPWINTLDATIEGNVCPQIDLITKSFTGDEDCLFINVFSPLTNLAKQTKTLKAVMVWIHGGSFKSGSSGTNLLGPDFLIENDVVVVSFNYRLGPLGFMTLNYPNATGNTGLKDQNLALKWVRSNIDKFGGDPNKVTIFGQSAGGVSVDYHVLSELSRGLFQRVISMSASPLNNWGFVKSEEGEKLAKKLVKILANKSMSNKDTLLRFLYGVKAYDLVMAAEQITKVIPSFRPTVEDASIAGGEVFISKCSVKKYATGEFNKVPHMMGLLANEAVTFADAVTPLEEMLDLTISTVESIGMRLPSSIAIFKNLISSNSSLINGVSKLARQAFIDDVTDILFKYGIDEKQRALVSNSPEPVYYYEITFNPEVSLHKQLLDINLSGAAHADDLAYIFHVAVADLPLDSTDPISITRNRVTRMWTNFAKYGNPTPDGTNDPLLNITWPASGSSGTHLRIDKELSIGGRPINTKVRLMELIAAPTARARNGCPITIVESYCKLYIM